MGIDLIHDRGRGPEFIGSRITVLDLLPYFLDATITEDDIRRLYGLSDEQVAAARAYVLNHPDTVLAEHLKIEERMAQGNPPEVIERAKHTQAILQKFREWLARRDEEEARGRLEEVGPGEGPDGHGRIPSFREWLVEQRSRPANGP